MTNKQYEKGKAKELRIKRLLIWEGWTVIRSAGSHGFADLVAINPRTKKIKWIQCKSGKYFTKELKKKLEEENKFCNGTYESSFEVI